jgi:hypothetical protein
MTPETLNVWAQAAAIYLFVNAIIVTLLTAIILGFGWWYLRKGRKALVKPLLTGQIYALRIQLITTKVSDRIAGVPVQLHTTTTQITTTAKVLSGRSNGNSNGSSPTL